MDGEAMDPNVSYVMKDGRWEPTTFEVGAWKPAEVAKATGPEPLPPRPGRPPTLEERAVEEFRRLGPMLTRGGAEQLGKMFAGKAGHASFEQRLRAVAEVLEGFGRRFVDPEHKPPTLEDGSPMSPLRALIRRFAADLRPGAEAAIYSELAPRTAGVKPVVLATILGRYLDREGARFFNEAWHARQFKVGAAKPSQAERPRDDAGRFSAPAPARRRNGF